MVYFQNQHGSTTLLAVQRIISEREQDRGTPVSITQKETTFFFGNTAPEILFLFVVFCIQAIIPEHLEMLFWYVNDEPLDEFHCRDTFRYSFIVVMSRVMKSNKLAIIVIDT